MKNLIVYFTSTGNSLKIAQDLAKGLGDTEIIGIPQALKQKNFEADTIGIVTPVYCWGLPGIVRDFVQKTTLTAKYVYAVTTYGGCPGDTLLQLNTELKKKGQSLQAGFGLQMPGNYTPMYGAQSLETQEKYFNKAQQKLPEIIATIQKKNPAPIAWGPWFISGILRLTRFYNMFISHVKNSDKAFFVQDNCDGCGICANVCPVNNIQLTNKKPAWQHNCENCLACLQWCPKEAIQYGKITVGRKRYHNPNITVKNIIAQK